MEPPRHQEHQGREERDGGVAPISAELDRIGAEIVDACFKVHSRLGPGLLESVYKVCLAHELRKRGLRVRTEVPVAVTYDDTQFDVGFRIDLLVEECVIVEVKAVVEDHPIFKAQTLTHLKLTNNRLGFLVNFNKQLIKDGIRRIAN